MEKKDKNKSGESFLENLIKFGLVALGGIAVGYLASKSSKEEAKIESVSYPSQKP
jgi:hypothetical protein